MSFSPDGTLFATSGKSDRLVKVWYENKNGKWDQFIFYVTFHIFNLAFETILIENSFNFHSTSVISKQKQR